MLLKLTDINQYEDVDHPDTNILNKLEGRLMKTSTINEIKKLIKKTINTKIDDYKAETDYKPFFEALFSKALVAQSSVVHSLYTTFGMSIYEQIAEILAINEGSCECTRQFKLLGSIDDKTRLYIDNICDTPIGASCKQDEVEHIRSIIARGDPLEDPDSTVDVFIKKPNGEEIYIDITSAKPNKTEVRALRRKFLRWTALRLSQEKSAKVSTYMGIPYNPHFPNEYSRSFVIDNSHAEDRLIQEALWTLCAGHDIYSELVEVFKEVGWEMKEKIDTFFQPSTLK